MALPSRKVQIEAVVKLLDQDDVEGMELEDLATIIVDGYLKLLKDGVKDAALTPHVGMAFNHPSVSGVHYVAYDTGYRAWVVTATSRFGAFVSKDNETFWRYADVSKDNRKPKKVKDESGGETGEVVPLGPRPGTPGHNPVWHVSDVVSTGQRAHMFTVVQTADKCVLLQDNSTGAYRAECNDNMEAYYRREGAKAEW